MKESSYSQSLPAILTLMYHRVHDVDTNPWNICISPKNFEEQICYLRENFNVISVDEVFDQFLAGEIKENSVCITFDDGYADNYFLAKPILEKYNCAATFFIATAFINQTKPYWWDELEMIFLHSAKLPKALSLKIGDEKVSYQLSEKELTKHQWQQHKKWKWHQMPSTDRCEIYLSIWEKLTALPAQEINVVLNELRKWSCYDIQNYPGRLPMNAEQLQELSANNLFTLALHTHNHNDLSSQMRQVQHKEITDCKKVLLEKFSIASEYFSYPFGRYNDDTIQLANNLQLKACFTTNASLVNAQSNKFLLGRYQPFNWNTHTFKKYLDNCFCNNATVIEQ